MTVLKFEMNGREFCFDGALEITADELWTLDELGVSESEIVAVLSGDRACRPERVARVFCVLAYLSARREDPATTWAQFARTIAPGTLKVIGMEPSGLGPALLADEKPGEQEAAGEKPKPKRAPRAKKTEKTEQPVAEPAPA